MNDFAGGMDEIFLLEASDLLDCIESQLIVLEKNPGDKPVFLALNTVARNFRTVKCGVGFMFYDELELVLLCRLTEEVLHKIGDGELPLDAKLLDMVLDSIGLIRSSLNKLIGEVGQQASMPDVLGAWGDVLHDKYHEEHDS